MKGLRIINPEDLPLGGNVSGTFSKDRERHYYIVDVPPGGHLNIKLDDLDDSGINGLYARRGSLPSLGIYDYFSSNPNPWPPKG